MITPTVKFGRNPSPKDPRNLKFRKYAKALTLPLPPAPAEVSWITKVPSWGMMLNDTLGDCVPAAQGHIVLQQTTYAGNGAVQLSDQEIELTYQKEGGYVPGDPTTDNGTDMLTALRFWRNTGLDGHRIAAYMSVNPLDLYEVRQAILLFGSVFLGLQLPNSLLNPDGTPKMLWTVADGGPFGANAPGTLGGHCVPAFAQSPQTISAVSWGQIVKMSHNFFMSYCDEAWVVLAADWIEKTGLSPSAFDYATLKADLAQLK